MLLFAVTIYSRKKSLDVFFQGVLKICLLSPVIQRIFLIKQTTSAFYGKKRTHYNVILVCLEETKYDKKYMYIKRLLLVILCHSVLLLLCAFYTLNLLIFKSLFYFPQHLLFSLSNLVVYNL